MTRKTKILGICLIAILIVAGSLSSYFCYGTGHSDGHLEGYNKGYEEGFEASVAAEFWANIEGLKPDTEYYFRAHLISYGGEPVNLPSICPIAKALQSED